MQIKNIEAELNARNALEKRPVEKGDQTKEIISEVAALSLTIGMFYLVDTT